MFIETLGSGPPLVLLHGWAMHSGLFAPLCEPLAQAFTLHLVDLPGHGRSDSALALDADAAVDALLDAVPTRAIWLGWSMGGLFALRAALRAPARVRALAMLASSPRFTQAGDWPGGVPAQVFEQFAAGLAQDPGATIERFLALEAIGSSLGAAPLRALHARAFEHGPPTARALAQGLSLLRESDLRDALADLRMPSLWIAGRRDRMVPPTAMRWAAQAAPDARLLELDTGHMPFLTAPEAVASALTELAARAG